MIGDKEGLFKSLIVKLLVDIGNDESFAKDGVEFHILPRFIMSKKKNGIKDDDFRSIYDDIKIDTSKLGSSFESELPVMYVKLREYALKREIPKMWIKYLIYAIYIRKVLEDNNEVDFDKFERQFNSEYGSIKFED